MTTLIPKFDLKNGGSTPTGAINRTIFEKLSDSVSVKDFGAIGDGTTDDSTAIQNAIDSFGGTFGSIYFPTGSYKLGSNITFASNIALLSHGSTIVCNGHNFNMAGKNDIVIDGLRFNQAFTTGTPTTISAGTCNRITIQNCAFYGGGFYGINFGGETLRVINNTFTDTPSQALLALNSAYDVVATGNQFYSIGLGYAILSRNSVAITISNNDFDTITNNPVFIDTGSQNVTITGNTLRLCGDSGILLANDLSGTAPSLVTISNNAITNSPNAGIGIIYGSNVSITGNVLVDNGHTGVSGFNSGIYLSGNQKKVSVVGNSISNVSFNPTAVYGIYANFADMGAGTTQDTELQITGNTYSGYADGNNIYIPITSGGTSFQPAKIQIIEGASRPYPTTSNIDFNAWASTLPDNISGLSSFSFAGTGATCTKETSTVVYGNSAKVVGGSANGVLTVDLTALNYFQEYCIVEVTAYVKANTLADLGSITLTAGIAGTIAPTQKINFGGSSTAWTPVTLRMVVGVVTNYVRIQLIANAGATVFFDEMSVNIGLYNN